jgi:ATP-dependent Clp protease ATP-binding subunit ClpA
VAAELSNRISLIGIYPDKAIDVIDEAGAKQRMMWADRKKVDIAEIEEIVSKNAKFRQIRSSNDIDKLANLEKI